MKSIFVIVVVLLVSVGCTQHIKQSDDIDFFIKKMSLANGETLLVTEGVLEPKSVGSYSLKIYAANPNFPTDQFLVGTIHERDGSIQNVTLKDVDGDQSEDIVVITLLSGSGRYMSAQAFSYSKKTINLLVSVDDLSSDTDPLQHLMEIFKAKR